jgi:hypothetical protein
LFAQLPAGFFSHHINGCPARDLVQPGRQNGVGLQLAGVSREIGKNGLGDFLGQLRGADLAERGGEDQIEVAPDDFGEGILGLLPGLSRE